MDFILGLFASGWTEQLLLANYPALSPETLRRVIAFAAEGLGDEAICPTRRKTRSLQFLVELPAPTLFREIEHAMVATHRMGL